MRPLILGLSLISKESYLNATNPQKWELLQHHGGLELNQFNDKDGYSRAREWNNQVFESDPLMHYLS